MHELAVLHFGIRILFVRRQIELHVVEGERARADRQKARLHVLFGFARLHQAAQVRVHAAVVEGIRIADEKRNLGRLRERRRHFGLHRVFKRCCAAGKKKARTERCGELLNPMHHRVFLTLLLMGGSLKRRRPHPNTAAAAECAGRRRFPL